MRLTWILNISLYPQRRYIVVLAFPSQQCLIDNDKHMSVGYLLQNHIHGWVVHVTHNDIHMYVGHVTHNITHNRWGHVTHDKIRMRWVMWLTISYICGRVKWLKIVTMIYICGYVKCLKLWHVNASAYYVVRGSPHVLYVNKLLNRTQLFVQF